MSSPALDQEPRSRTEAALDIAEKAFKKIALNRDADVEGMKIIAFDALDALAELRRGKE